jgi:hypothetical protein
MGAGREGFRDDLALPGPSEPSTRAAAPAPTSAHGDAATTALALQRLVGNRKASEMLAPKGEAVHTSARLVAPTVRRALQPRVQRDVGFEFESNQLLTRQGDAEIGVPFASEDEAINAFWRSGAKRLAKGEKIFSKPGISVEADDRGSNSDLEVVVKHLPETNTGRNQLDQQMTDLLTLVTHFSTQAAHTGDTAPATVSDGQGGFGVENKKAMIQGPPWDRAKTAPQVTVGARLSNVGDLVRDLHGDPNESAPEAGQRAAGRMAMRGPSPNDSTKPKTATGEAKLLIDAHGLAQQAVNSYLAKNNGTPPGGRELEGFLTLVLAYAEAAPHKSAFLKNSTPLMAKTDLATMWGTLPGPVRTHYSQTSLLGKTELEKLLETLPGYKGRLDRPLFDVSSSAVVDENASFDKKGVARKTQWYHKLVMRNWVRKIVTKNVDQLTTANFPKLPGGREVEGYGVLGPRMDADATQPATALPVFELRSASRLMTYGEAHQWALKMFDYIRSLNANPGGGHGRIT